MIGQPERIDVHKITMFEPGPALPFDPEKDITQKDWEGILKTAESEEGDFIDYIYLSDIKTLSYSKYKQIKIKPAGTMSYHHFDFKRHPYTEVVHRLELVASLKDLFNYKLDWWQESRLHGQFLEHRKKGNCFSRLGFYNLGREALGRRVDISEFPDKDKQECLEKLNNNFDPEHVGHYKNYVNFADLFTNAKLTYKPDAKAWKAMRTYLAMFRDHADDRDWIGLVDCAVIFKAFTAYTQNDQEFALPEMRRY